MAPFRCIRSMAPLLIFSLQKVPTNTGYACQLQSWGESLAFILYTLCVILLISVDGRYFLFLVLDKAVCPFLVKVLWDADLAPHLRKVAWRTAQCQSGSVSYLSSVYTCHVPVFNTIFVVPVTLSKEQSSRRISFWTRILFIWSTTPCGVWDSKRRLRPTRLYSLFTLWLLYVLYHLNTFWLLSHVLHLLHLLHLY